MALVENFADFDVPPGIQEQCTVLHGLGQTWGSAQAASGVQKAPNGNVEIPVRLPTLI